jgi:hypothetical protein
MQLQIQQTNFAPNFSAKHTQLQQLHRGSAPKKGGVGPNSMVLMECLRGYSTNSKSLWSWKKLPTTPQVSEKMI